MAATTARVRFTRTVTYAFTADYPNYSALTDAEILAAASLPNGTLAVGELLAGSSANNGAITPGAWSVTSNTDIEPYFVWLPSTALALSTRVTPTVPTDKLYSVTTAGTTSTTEPTWPTTLGQTVTNGTAVFTCIAKF